MSSYRDGHVHCRPPALSSTRFWAPARNATEATFPLGGQDVL